MIPRHSVIALRVLQEKGYQEDEAARRRLERPYGYFAIPGLILFLGSVVVLALAPYELSHRWTTMGVGSALIGLALSFVAWWRILYARPTNPQTHYRLDIYERADTRTKEGFLEWIYADHEAKTYFVRPVRFDRTNTV